MVSKIQKSRYSASLGSINSLVVCLFVLCSGCAAHSSDTAKFYRYVSISPGPGFAYIINPETRTLSPLIEGAFDSVPKGLEICNSQSKLFCFYEKGKGITFGVPRDGLERDEFWEINQQSFRVVRQLSAPDCGEDYIIESADKDGPVGIFSFNYVHGLRSMLFVDSVETVVLEEVTGDIYRYGAIYFADGLGFGGTGTCAVD